MQEDFLSIWEIVINLEISAIGKTESLRHAKK